jgi:hypothetical protein
MALSEENLQTLRALVEAIIMNEPGRERVMKHLTTALDDDEAALWLEQVRTEAYSVFGQDFVSLAVETRDELLDRLESGNWRTRWNVDVQGVLERIVAAMEDGYKQGVDV